MFVSIFLTVDLSLPLCAYMSLSLIIRLCPCLAVSESVCVPVRQPTSRSVCPSTYQSIRLSDYLSRSIASHHLYLYSLKREVIHRWLRK